jgi:hypothetical protein
MLRRRGSHDNKRIGDYSGNCIQETNGFKDSVKRLLFSFVHDKLDTKILKEMVSDDVTGVDVSLRKTYFK